MSGSTPAGSDGVLILTRNSPSEDRRGRRCGDFSLPEVFEAQLDLLSLPHPDDVILVQGEQHVNTGCIDQGKDGLGGHRRLTLPVVQPADRSAEGAESSAPESVITRRAPAPTAWPSETYTRDRWALTVSRRVKILSALTVPSAYTASTTGMPPARRKSLREIKKRQR